MRRFPIHAVIAFAASALLAGCITLDVSLHPYYLNEQVIFEPCLIGDWATDDSTRAGWVFARHGADAYDVTMLGPDDPSDLATQHFLGHLFRLENATLLDLEPGTLADSLDVRRPRIAVLPAHLLLYVDLESDSLWLSVIDSNWLDELSRKHSKSFGYEEIDIPDPDPWDYRVMTSTAEEFQPALKKELRRGPPGVVRLFGAPDKGDHPGLRLGIRRPGSGL